MGKIDQLEAAAVAEAKSIGERALAALHALVTRIRLTGRESGHISNEMAAADEVLDAHAAATGIEREPTDMAQVLGQRAALQFGGAETEAAGLNPIASTATVPGVSIASLDNPPGALAEPAPGNVEPTSASTAEGERHDI